MNPCRQFKQRIALSTVEGETDAALQQHLIECASCRTYAEEIRSVCVDHDRRASQLPKVDAPFRLRANLRAALGVERRISWLLPTAAAAAAAFVVALYLHSRPAPSHPAVVTKPPQHVVTNPEPSYAAYRNHLSRSTEELEGALSRFDAPAGASNEVLTVSSWPGEL